MIAYVCCCISCGRFSLTSLELVAMWGPKVLSGHCKTNRDRAQCAAYSGLIVRLAYFEPLDESSDSLFYRRLRVIAQQSTGPGDVGICLRDIAGLQRLSIDFCL